MANEQNLKPIKTLSSEEAKKRGQKGGKASGEARRKRANFKKVLTDLLTQKIDVDDITPLLESMGIDSTLESAINMAMIKKALDGNVGAYLAIRDTLGLDKTKLDKEEQKAKINQLEAQTQMIQKGLESEKEEAIQIIFKKAKPEEEKEHEDDSICN